MKNYLLRCRSNWSLILIFLVSSNLYAENPIRQTDVREILERSETALFQNGVTKTTRAEPSSTGKRLTTKYYYKNKNNERFVYWESILTTDRSIYTNIKIYRPDGNWSLCSQVAIREPDEMINEMRNRNILYRDSKPIQGTVDDYLEEGVSYIRVVFFASKEQDEDVQLNVTNSINKTTDVRSDAMVKKTKELAMRLAPYRYEYLIDEETGISMVSRIYTKSGKLLDEIKISVIDKNCDFPVSNFDVPKNYRIIFPDTASEYMSCIRKYLDKTNKQTKQKMGTERPTK